MDFYLLIFVKILFVSQITSISGLWNKNSLELIFSKKTLIFFNIIQLQNILINYF